jgi:hypothetical protein
MNVFVTTNGIAVTGSTPAVMELPKNHFVISGVTPPAEAPGPKTFAGITRGSVGSIATAGLVLLLSASAQAKSTGTTWLHDGKVQLSGIARASSQSARCVLTTGAAGGYPTRIDTSGTWASINSASLSVTAPAARQVGDLLIAACFAPNTAQSNPVQTTYSGWNILYFQSSSGGSGAYSTTNPWMFWRWADGTSADNITFVELNFGSNVAVIGNIFCYRYVDSTKPFVTVAFSGVEVGSASAQDFGSGFDYGGTYAEIGVWGDARFTNGTYNQTQYLKNNALGVMWLGFTKDEVNSNFTFQPGYAPSSSNYDTNTAAEDSFVTSLAPASLYKTTAGSDAAAAEYARTWTGGDVDYMSAWLRYLVADVGTGGTLRGYAAFLRPFTIYYQVNISGSAAAKSSASLSELYEPGVVQMAGSCIAKCTSALSGLQPVVRMDGALHCSSSATAFVTIPPPAFSTEMRCRTTDEVVLTVGTTHMPQALLQAKCSATLSATVNYMKMDLYARSTATCWLRIDRILEPSLAAARVNSSLSATHGRRFAAILAARATGTAQLSVSLQGSLYSRSDLFLSLIVLRKISGAASAAASCSMPLRVLRYMSGTLGVRSSGSANLQNLRFSGGIAAARCSMVISAQVLRDIGGGVIVPIGGGGGLEVVRKVPPYWLHEVFVTPEEVIVSAQDLTVQVELPYQLALVED